MVVVRKITGDVTCGRDWERDLGRDLAPNLET